MKTKLAFNLACFGFALIGLISCETEIEQPVEPGNPGQLPIIQFIENEVTINENQSQYKVELNLSRPTQRNGSVSIVLSSDQLTGIATEPSNSNGRIELPVTVGSTSISFLVKPVDNTTSDGDKTLSVLISNISSGLYIGNRDTLSVHIVDDEEGIDDRVEANFLTHEYTFSENAAHGSVISVNMASAAPESGIVGIVYSSDKLVYGVDFVTEPASENRKITLPLSAGADQVSFKVIPINNQFFNGDQKVVFTLTNAQGGVRLGQGVVTQLNIIDDELAPKMIGYETVGSGWKVKRLFEYDDSNNLVKITWEQYTPSYQGGAYIYHYHQGRLHKMVENANRETYYMWEGNRIIKEEQYTNGLLSKYVFYNYDQAGNIGEAVFHYRQADGSMKRGLLFVYLYFTDGNLYKKMAYNPIEGSGEYSLISTTTYDNYLDVANPFPLEILPNVNPQPKLPGTLTEEGNGHNTLYNFSYEFDSSGRPLKRTAVSSKASEVTNYTYR